MIETRRSTFNKRGDVVSSITEYYEDGVADGAASDSYSYDAHRNLIGILEESDFDGDGVIDYVRTSTLTYDRVQAEH